MSQKKGTAIFFGVLLIPLISSVVWSVYYGIDQASTIRFLRLLIPLTVGIYVVTSFILWAVFPKLGKRFKIGFYLGLFFLAPFYLFQVANLWLGTLGNLPVYILYGIYFLSQIVSSVACGLIVWSAGDLLLNVKNSLNPGAMALKRLALMIICFLLLFPAFAKNRAAQAELVKKRQSYRAHQEREFDGKPLQRVIVLGVDGADWDVINPILEEGNLPNFKKLMREGRWGTLMSENPMRSPVLWTTIFTGQPPSRHGVEDWLISYSKNRLVKSVWNILSEYELRSTIINIPGTFPPEEIVGKEISGFPYPNQTLNTNGWLNSSKVLNTAYTPNMPLDMKLAPDGTYSGKLTISDVLMDKFVEKTKHNIVKNMWLEYAMKDKIGEFYGEAIDIGRYRWFEDKDQIDILPLKGSEVPLATLNEGEWSDFILVQIAPGIVGTIKIKAIKLSSNEVILYITPIFSPSENPRYEFTFPKALAKHITELFGQYVVEMTWMSAKDHMLIPTIKELLDFTEGRKSQVGKALIDEDEWDLFIQIFSLTDRLQHPTWVFKYGDLSREIPPDLHNSEEVKQAANDAIREAYIAADKWIGDMLQNVNSQKDVVLVLSDHGFKAGVNREAKLGVHRAEGVYIVWGGPADPISRSNLMENKSGNKSIRDITKNLLYLIGLPVGEDMVGEVWLDLFDQKYVEEHPVETIDTYNVAEAIKGTQQKVDPSTLEQLKGLGYIDGGNIEGN